MLLHLCWSRLFLPARELIPPRHGDTGCKFREMIAFRHRHRHRHRRAAETEAELRTWANPSSLAQGIGPASHSATVHTDVIKTARRDEEKSRAKERIFSFRNAQHRWDPKNQRPELWDLYNTRIHKGESVRVFLTSNWTRLDVWLRNFRENIPVPSLYFARECPVVERDGALIMVDDERLPLSDGETPVMRHVRFRVLTATRSPARSNPTPTPWKRSSPRCWCPPLPSARVGD